MDRLFGRFDGGVRRLFSPVEYPAVNLWEDKEHFYVEAELPGMAIDDLDVFVTNGNQLTISGERKAAVAEGVSWHRRERGQGKFTRVIELPGSVREDGVEAHLKLGVLTLKLPKSDEAKPRRIAVQAD